MTFPAEASSIVHIKSKRRKGSPTLNMMSLESSSCLAAFGTASIRFFYNRIPPFDALYPITLSLFKRGISALEVPMRFSSKKCQQFMTAWLRTSSAPSIRLIRYLFSAHLAVKCYAPVTFIVGGSTKVPDTVALYAFRRSLQSDIPGCWLATSQMLGAESWNTEHLHSVTDCTPTNSVHFANYFWANALRAIEQFQDSLGHMLRSVGSMCISTNTWQKSHAY